MNYIFDGIKIDEKKLSENSDEISSIYMLKMGFKELIEVCGLGKISINREVDEYRSEKMVEYIKEKSTFYPTILVATMKKNLIIYDEKNKTIEINSDNNKDIVVIDGQHRYKSIELLLKENYDENSNRTQSVLLLDNTNEFQQRKIFIDVNDNSKKVTVGTKLRLERSLINYISLNMVNKMEYLQKRVMMDDNQAKDFETIPYKFIIKGNRELFKEVEKKYNNKQIELEYIDKRIETIINLWKKIFALIDVGVEQKCNVIITEVFYIALCKEISNDINKYFNNDKYFDSFFENMKTEIKSINEKFYSANINKSKEKIEFLISLMEVLYE
ncbi:DGQHR domain-containing protein [Clostridium perfringens]|nr:DGQHR domain-containing protein [Clostridium perfringens]